MGFTVEWEGNNPLLILEGDIIFDDLYYLDGKIYGDSRFDLTQYICYNMLEVNSLNVTKNDIAAISALDKSASRWNAKIKLAIVVQDEHIRREALLYIDFMKDSSWETKVFSALNEALDWCRK